MTRLEQFLRSDRQWPRNLRIEHAKYQMKLAQTSEDKSFWRQVLLANTENIPAERIERERPRPAKDRAAKPKSAKAGNANRLPGSNGN